MRYSSGHEVEHRIYQLRLSRGSRALDDDRQRLVELPRCRGEVRNELIRALVDRAASIAVSDNTVEEIRRAEKLHRTRAISFAADALPIRNVMLLERLAEIEKLDHKDQEMIVELIHSVLARRSIEAAAMP